MSVVEVQPLVVSLNSCRFGVTVNADDSAHLTFIHNSGVIAFQAVLPPEAVDELVRQLRGIAIAQVLPVPTTPPAA